MGKDGSVVLGGMTKGDWDGVNVGEGTQDMVAVRLDADGNLLWKWQVGT